MTATSVEFGAMHGQVACDFIDFEAMGGTCKFGAMNYQFV